MVVSPADVRMVYRVVFPNQSLPLDSQVLSHFSNWFAISSNQSEHNYISYKSSLANWCPDLSSMVEPGKQHTPLHPLSVNKILEH